MVWLMAITPSRIRVAALILSCAGLAIAASSGRAAVQAGWAQQETPSAALARHMRLLATSPKNFNALIGAGKAAIALDDIQSAIGFFGRAEEVFPASPLPHAGMGAALVASGDANGALPYFVRAQQLGANGAMIGNDRGLAYDILGRHAEAQQDYRSAMMGTEADEARRRLALSLAITGKKDEAIGLLGPLMARGDPAAARSRALVLAVSGDTEGARRLLDAAMPGSSARMAPFFAKLPSLRSDQKAAAVHLGIFPSSGQSSYAASSVPSYTAPSYTAPSYTPPASSGSIVTQPVTGDRLIGIEQLLRVPAPQATVSPPLSQPVQVASVTPPTREQISASQGNSQVTSAAKERIWVQLASGTDAAALPGQFRRLKTRYRDLLDGISGYVAEEPDKVRLLIGPFKSRADARILQEDLESVSVDAFSWTSPPGQMIRKLSTE